MHQDIKDTVAALIGNRYVYTVVIFLAWIGIFDGDNLITKYGYSQKIAELEEERANLKKEIEQDRRKMDELRNDRASLEKFAREEYFMKKEDEVIFIIK